jgi:hypothetical protein
MLPRCESPHILTNLHHQCYHRLRMDWTGRQAQRCSSLRFLMKVAAVRQLTWCRGYIPSCSRPTGLTLLRSLPPIETPILENLTAPLHWCTPDSVTSNHRRVPGTVLHALQDMHGIRAQVAWACCKACHTIVILMHTSYQLVLIKFQLDTKPALCRRWCHLAPTRWTQCSDALRRPYSGSSHDHHRYLTQHPSLSASPAVPAHPTPLVAHSRAHI